MRKVTYAVWTLAAICAAALLLVACGNSPDGTTSSRDQSPNTSAEAPEDGTGNSTKKAEGGGAAHDSKPKRARSKNSAGNADPTPNKARSKKTQGSTSPRSESPKPVHVDGCVTGMTKSECKAVGKAYEQQRGSTPHVVEEGECPGGLSESECRQAGEAYEEDQQGHVIKPDECPRAMTADQCAEAGRAYEEAMK